MKESSKGGLSKQIDWNNMGIILALAAIILVFSVMTKAFLTPNNIANIARQISIVGICAVGMTCVVLTGGMDLSIGSLIGVVAVVCATLMSNGVPVLVVVLVGMMIGAANGIIIATCVTKLHIPPIITTLGLMITLRGVAYLVSGGMPIYGIPEGFKVIGQGSIGIVPISMIIMVLVFVFGTILLNKTVFGRRIYGIGGNQETAHLSGINITKELYKMYIMVGVFGSIAALILMSRVNSGQPSAGDGYEMDIMTAVVLGGVSVSGGEGKLSKVIVGVIFMGVLANGMMMLNINEYWQRVVKGLVLLIAVAIDIKSREKKAKRVEV